MIAVELLDLGGRLWLEDGKWAKPMIIKARPEPNIRKVKIIPKWSSENMILRNRVTIRVKEPSNSNDWAFEW